MNAGIVVRGVRLEYPGVARRSSDPAALRRAHETPISPSAAIDLVFVIFAAKGFDRVPSVTFRGYRGQASKKKWTIALPEATDRRAVRNGVRALRLGIVLHECAHLLAEEAAAVRAKPSGPLRQVAHGPEFVRVLDDLVMNFGVSAETVAS